MGVDWSVGFMVTILFGCVRPQPFFPQLSQQLLELEAFPSSSLAQVLQVAPPSERSSVVQLSWDDFLPNHDPESPLSQNAVVALQSQASPLVQSGSGLLDQIGVLVPMTQASLPVQGTQPSLVASQNGSGVPVASGVHVGQASQVGPAVPVSPASPVVQGTPSSPVAVASQVGPVVPVAQGVLSAPEALVSPFGSAVPVGPASSVTQGAQSFPVPVVSQAESLIPVVQTSAVQWQSLQVAPASPEAPSVLSSPVAVVSQAGSVTQGSPVVQAVQSGSPAVQAPFLSQLYQDGIQAPGSQASPALGIPAPVSPVSKKPQVRSVTVECRENSVLVVAQRDLLGVGHVIQPSEITLGGCHPSGRDASANVLLFQSPLEGCGSVLTMSGDALIYRFQLVYVPQNIGSTPIVRTNGAVVNVECRYLRFHNVSSNALKPTWIPYFATKAAENILLFSLQFMSDDWQSKRASNVYILGDMINIEASVIKANHVPLRVFVDSCVATLTPDVKSVPRYAFMENNGCLVDTKLSSSRSRFMPRTQDDKLRFQVDAFRFSGDARSAIYFTCRLKATPASYATDSQNKACSYVLNASRWVAASGNDQVCSCCETICARRKGRSLSARGSRWTGVLTVGPFFVDGPPMARKLVT